MEKQKQRALTAPKANAGISSPVDNDAVDYEDFVTLDHYGEPH